MGGVNKFVAFAAAMLLAATVNLAAGHSAMAQQMFSDLHGVNTTVRLPGRGALASITVSKPFRVTSIGTRTRTTADHNLRFVIYNGTTNTYEYISAPKPFPADGVFENLKMSDPFPVVTLQPGTVYYIGTTHDQQTIYYFDSGSVTQGVVTNTPNNAAFIGTFNAPVFECCYTARMDVLISGPGVYDVPTLTEWAMIGLGVALAGGAAVLVQRRRTVRMAL